MDFLALFFWSFLAATIVPLGSEPALAALVYRDDAVVIPVLVASIGNVLGACTTYALGRFARTQVPASPRARNALDLVRLHGAPTLLLSWVPFLGDALVVAAGAARVPFLPFLLWTTVGKTARYLLLALLITSAVR